MSLPAWAPWIASVLGFAATLYLFYPGIMDWDSTWQAQQAVTGVVDNAHPPIMVYLWALTNRVLFGSAGMLVVQSAAYWAGLALVATSVTRSARLRVALVLGIGLFPPLLGLMGVLLKDQGAAAALTLTVGLLAESQRRGRAWPVWLALPFAFYALAARFNNVFTVIPLVWWLSDRLFPFWRGGSKAIRRAVAFGAVFAVLLLSTSLVNTVGVKRYSYFAAVPLWDLAQISLMTDQMLVPEAAIARPGLDLKRLREISRTYRCDYERITVNGKQTQDILWEHLSVDESREIVGSWLAAVAAHPVEYLRHRGRVMARLLGDPEPVFVLKSIPVWFSPAFYEFSPRPGWGAFEWLLGVCANGLLCWPWVYGLLAFAVWGYAWRSGSEQARLAGAVAASGLLSVLPLFVLTPSIDYRYSLWLVAAALISAALLYPSSGIAKRSR
jgi:hypothetical protein